MGANPNLVGNLLFIEMTDILSPKKEKIDIFFNN